MTVATQLEIRAIPPSDLGLYAQVPIRFEVRSRLRVALVNGGLGGMRLVEELVDPPYVKDYDADGGGDVPDPLCWPQEFDVREWAFFLAVEGGRPVGAATVATNTPEVRLLDGRRDLALLWDLRVSPEARGRGIGTALFRQAAEWSRARGCRQMKVETQNINVPACRFYAAQGCRLGALHRYAYAADPALAHETMLLWYLDLQCEGPGGPVTGAERR